MFLYLEDAPLLVVLDDFIQDLDQLLLQYERGPGNGGEGEEGEGEMKEEEDSDVDGKYVALLEMQCLLQQRLNDVQHRWLVIYNTFIAMGKVHESSRDYNYAGQKFQTTSQ